MSAAGPDRDDIALAGEYALGLLEGEERAAFEARLAREPQLRALVAEWSGRLSALSGEVGPVTPPERIRAALDERLSGPRPRPAPAVARRRRLLVAGGSAVAAAVALGLLYRLFGERQTGYVAEISAEDRSLLANARVRAGPGGVELVLEIRSGGPRPGRSLELWLIPPDSPRPVSLGVLPPGETARFVIPDAFAGRLEGAILAFSDEPPGGSPTGQPTGEVLAHGRLSAAAG